MSDNDDFKKLLDDLSGTLGPTQHEFIFEATTHDGFVFRFEGDALVSGLGICAVAIKHMFVDNKPADGMINMLKDKVLKDISLDIVHAVEQQARAEQAKAALEGRKPVDKPIVINHPTRLQ